MGVQSFELIDEPVSWGDLGYLAQFDRLNQGLIDERSAATLRAQEDLEEAYRLGMAIEKGLLDTDGQAVIAITEGQKRVLGISRRLGGTAAPSGTELM